MLTAAPLTLLLPSRPGGVDGRDPRVDDVEHRPFAISVLRIPDGHIVEITAFHDPEMFPAFALPAALPPAQR